MEGNIVGASRTFTPRFDQHAPGLVTGYSEQPTWTSDDGAVRLWQGDCRPLLASLPDGCCDLVATDPPYGIEYVTNRRVASDAPAMLASDDVAPLDTVCDMARVVRDGGAVYMFTRFDVSDQWRRAMVDAGLTIKTPLFWDKTNHTAGDLDGDYGGQVELILFAHKGRHGLRDGRDTNLWRCPRPKPGIHPTPKPVDLMRRIIRNSTDSGELVLDPFMGTGTTGVACARLGRRFWGAEIDGPFYEHARDRIRGELDRHPLFESRMRQTALVHDA